jgi:cytochrome c-type biogenesis protein CcmF
LELRTLLSEEWAILLTNITLSGWALVVLWGTLFPSVSEALLGRSLTLGAPWFSAMSRPFGIALLFLLAICRALNWGRTDWRAFARRMALPLAVALGVAAVALAGGVKHGAALLAYALAVAVLLAMIVDALRIAKAKAKTSQVSLASALWNLIGRQRRLYGSYIVHIGVAVMFIGIVGSSTFSRSVTRTVSPGETIEIGKYALRFEGLKTESHSDRTSVVARVSVTNSGKAFGEMTSRKDFYPNYEPVTEVGIRSRIHEDLYLVLAGYERDGRATLQVFVNPLTLWLWVGGALAAVGGIVAWLPPRREKTQRTPPKKR